MQRCVGEWGPSSPRHQTHPSPQLVEFKMSEREVPITIVQRVVIKFLTNENVGPNEIWRRLCAQYGEATLWKTQVKFWHKEFRGGRDAVQSITPENIAAVGDLSEGNRRLTVVEICQEFGIGKGSGSLSIKKERFPHSRRAAASRQCQTPFCSPNPRKIGSDVLDCPRIPAVQPGPLPLRLPRLDTLRRR